MKIINKEKSIRSFLELYSNQLRELKEPKKKDNPITVQDIIDINTEMALSKNHINFTYANTNETQASAQFANGDVNVSKCNLEKIIEDTYPRVNEFSYNDEFDIASKIICSMISDPIFTYQNSTTALSTGLYYLYKNGIELDMPGDKMYRFLQNLEDNFANRNVNNVYPYMRIYADSILRSYVRDLDKDNTSYDIDIDIDLPGDVIE